LVSGSEKLYQTFSLDVRVAENAPQKLGVEDLLGVKRYVTRLPEAFL
jgi:hypothetical protein